jgi:hypothetical protein
MPRGVLFEVLLHKHKPEKAILVSNSASVTSDAFKLGHGPMP